MRKNLEKSIDNLVCSSGKTKDNTQSNFICTTCDRKSSGHIGTYCFQRITLSNNKI